MDFKMLIHYVNPNIMDKIAHQFSSGEGTMPSRKGGCPLVSSNMAGWKIPYEWWFLARTFAYKWSIFQQAMFDYQRVQMLLM